LHEAKSEGGFLEALMQAARTFALPMGISWIDTASAQQKRTIEYQNTTVLEIIEDIAKTEPGYEVSVKWRCACKHDECAAGAELFVSEDSKVFRDRRCWRHKESLGRDL